MRTVNIEEPSAHLVANSAQDDRNVQIPRRFAPRDDNGWHEGGAAT